MGRPKHKGKRTKSGQLSRSLDAMLDRNPPNLVVLERRNLFAFVRPDRSKRLDGREGEVDSEVCDGIGQLHALGLLDGHGLDPLELRNAGRFYGQHYWSRYRETGPKTGKYERTDKSISAYLGETGEDRRFDRMDEALRGFERNVILSLVVDMAWGDEIVPWAQALIDEALLARGKVRRGVVRFPDMEDRERLAACIRGLCTMVDGSMTGRYERAA